MDELGFSIVQNHCLRIVGMKGKKCVGSVSSAERGVNTTVFCCCSADGMYVPPINIFKGKQLVLASTRRQHSCNV
jgi:hypothetical protein